LPKPRSDGRDAPPSTDAASASNVADLSAEASAKAEAGMAETDEKFREKGMEIYPPPAEGDEEDAPHIRLSRRRQGEEKPQITQER
jgi:hypothetical protein